MSALNTLDYIIFIFAMVWAVWGAIRGFLEELAQKFGYVIGFMTGLMFTASLASFFQERLSLPYWIAAFISYLILFLLGYLFIKMIGNVLQTIFKTANLTLLDNFLGFFLGLLEGIIILGILEKLLLNQSVVSISNYIDGSFLSQKVILPFMNFISGFVKGLW